jgi:hypothetical protein
MFSALVLRGIELSNGIYHCLYVEILRLWLVLSFDVTGARADMVETNKQ